MNPALEESLVERLKRARASATTDQGASSHRARASDCTSAARLDEEMRALFFGRPVVAGLSPDAPSPGDWFVFDAVGRSVLVWRQADGGLRAFANVCRHRGMRVCDGRGRATRAVACPYHGWSYSPSGAVHSVPQEAGFDDLDLSGRGLVELPSAEDAGLVFVGLAPDVEIGRNPLEGVTEELAPFDLASWTRFDAKERTIAANWKMAVESFMEAYHLHHLHEKTLRESYLDAALYDSFGPHGRLVGIRRSIDDYLAGRDGDSVWPHTNQLWQIFPNTVLIHQQDHFELVQVFPSRGRPGEAHVRMTLYCPEPPASESAGRHWQRNLELLDRVTGTEDYGACERIQKNLESGLVDDVVIGRNEPGVAHFRRSIDDALALRATRTAAG